DLPVDPVPEPDEDPGSEPGFRFGQRAGQQISRAPANGFEPRRGIGRALKERERSRVERAPGADPFQVLPIWAVRSRAGPPTDVDPIARLDRRVARQGGGQSKAARAVLEGPERGDLVTVPRR